MAKAKNEKITSERFLIECPNANCKKQIEPITYFTGELYCPECKEEIAKKLLEQIVKESDPTKICAEYFAISQQYFIRYLLDIVPQMRKLGGPDQKGEYDALYKQGQKYLRQAVAYCKRAAYAGNPYALVNLVYYYKSGYDVTVSNRDIATKKLSAVIKGIFSDPKIQNPELAQKINERLNGLVTETSAAKDASGLEYLRNLIEASTDKSRERKPLFGVFTINGDKLNDKEKEELVDLIHKAAKQWTSKDVDGLYLYNKKEREWEPDNELTVLEDIEGIMYFGYRNANCHSASRRMKREMREVLAADRSEITGFFTDIVFGRTFKWNDDNRTVCFCDVDIYLCEDKDKNHTKLDDLKNKLIEVLENDSTER